MDRPQQAAAAWRRGEVQSPVMAGLVPVVCAIDLPYVPGGHRFQTLDLYLPQTPETLGLVGRPVEHLPGLSTGPALPGCLVHVHGGAWRDLQLTARSIEPTVAHAFAALGPIVVIAAINYTISPFPEHPAHPYDPSTAHRRDPAREAVHPRHLDDVFHALAHLRELGVGDGAFLLSGHSCGACLAFQSMLAPASHYELAGAPVVPTAAAVLGFNGLYDLPALVDGLDASHAHLRDEYHGLLSIAFGPDRQRWESASPALIDPAMIAARVRQAKAPPLILLDQSAQDQLVPMNQRDRFAARLAQVEGLRTVIGHRCSGDHADAWQRGDMIWRGVEDALARLAEGAMMPRDAFINDRFERRGTC